MRRRRGSGLVLSALSAAALAGWLPALAAEEAAKQQEERDWPSVIATLQQETYRRPGQSPVRAQLAIAYNNYGVALGNQRQWDQAIRQLEEAMRLEPQNAQFQENLSRLYVNQAQEAHNRHAPDEALAAVDRALTLAPGLATAHVLRGDIEYARQRLREAQAAWRRALELDPDSPDVAERLAQVTDELPVESKFERLSQAYFDLRYEDQLERPAGFDIQDALLEARRTIGANFAYWPRHKLVVLIYSAESFRRLRHETPEWVAGQFDGKIRVPLPSAQLNQATVRQILFHEYTHALIHDLTSGRCPTWLNEGLAEYEGRTQVQAPVSRLAAAHPKRLIPWKELSEHISMDLPAEQVGLAYEESYSIVAYLMHRYGFWRIRRLLKLIGEGQLWDEAISAELHLRPGRLEQAWKEWLPEFLSASGR